MNLNILRIICECNASDENASLLKNIIREQPDLLNCQYEVNN